MVGVESPGKYAAFPEGSSMYNASGISDWLSILGTSVSATNLSEFTEVPFMFAEWSYRYTCPRVVTEVGEVGYCQLCQKQGLLQPPCSCLPCRLRGSLGRRNPPRFGDSRLK